jgi:hypothetical protein
MMAITTKSSIKVNAENSPGRFVALLLRRKLRLPQPRTKLLAT